MLLQKEFYSILQFCSSYIIDAQLMMKKHCATVTIKHDWLHWHFYGGQQSRRVFFSFISPNFSTYYLDKSQKVRKINFRAIFKGISKEASRVI